MTSAVRVAALMIGGKPDEWRGLGFEVSDSGVAMLGPVRIELSDAVQAGTIGRWALEGEDVPGSIDGLQTLAAERGGPDAEHPNGATRIDHLVVLTPSLERTQAAFAQLDVECRRVREAGGGVRQGFFLVDDLLVEAVEGAGPEAEGPARFWGITVEVADIDRTAELLGDRVGRVKEAVQPGRRIATVRAEASGGLPLALITPRRKR